MKIVTMHAAKTNLSKLIARALAGEEIVIARGAQPVAKLVPLTGQPPRRAFGSLKGTLVVGRSFNAPLPDAELAGWE